LIKVKGVLLSVLISCLLFYCLDCYWSNWLEKQNSEKQIWIMNKENKRYNIAFLGASRVYTCIDVGLIEKILKIKAINLGCDGSSLMENYVVLSQFLKHGNKINKLYLQLDQTALSNMKKALSYPFHDYLFLNKLKEEEVKEAFIEDKGCLKYYFWRYIPLSKYAEFNHFYTLNFLEPKSQSKDSGFDKNSGSKLIVMDMPDSLLAKVKSGIFRQDTFVCDEKSKYYIDKIIKLCKSNGIKYDFFKMPIYNDSYIQFHSNHEMTTFLHEYARKNDCRFIDFQGLALASNKDYFKDYSHLNASGAKLFTPILSDSIGKINR
jgi:hypothetical protein